MRPAGGEREIETVSEQLRPDSLVEPLDPTVSVLVPELFSPVSEYIPISFTAFRVGFLSLANERVLSILCQVLRPRQINCRTQAAQ